MHPGARPSPAALAMHDEPPGFVCPINVMITDATGKSSFGAIEDGGVLTLH